VRSFQTETKNVTILDAPGHKEFVPNMITGAAVADIGLLVINALEGEFEKGFKDDNQTKEHVILAKSLGITTLIVAINKLDMVCIR
jgi:elongation factor 1 alpha-like protein